MDIKFFIKQKSFLIQQIPTTNFTQCQKIYFKILNYDSMQRAAKITFA